MPTKIGDQRHVNCLDENSRSFSTLQTVLAQHIGPQHHQHANVGEEDDGRRPAGAVDMEIGKREKDGRGEELQRVGRDVEQDVHVPWNPQQESHLERF